MFNRDNVKQEELASVKRVIEKLAHDLSGAKIFWSLEDVLVTAGLGENNVVEALIQLTAKVDSKLDLLAAELGYVYDDDNNEWVKPKKGGHHA